MNRIITIILIFLSLNATTQNLDSLWNVWNDKTQAETSRIKAMNKIAFDGYLFSQPDSAFYFAELQYNFAESVNNKKWMASALRTQGISFAIRGNTKKALFYYKKSLEICKEIADKKGIANCLNCIGVTYKEQGNYGKAIDYLTKSLRIQEELENKGGIANSLNNIGSIYIIQNNYDEALNYYKKTLKIFREIGKKDKNYANTLRNTGLIYKNKFNYNEAMKYYKKCLKIYKEIGDKGGIASSLIAIGVTYYNQNDYAKALNYYKMSLRIHKEIGDKKSIATALGNIGFTYQKQGKNKAALTYLIDALNISKKINALDLVYEHSQALYKIYKQLGDSKKALEIYELHIASKDTLAQQDAKEAATELMYKYRYETKAKVDSVDNLRVQQVKDKEIARQQAELEVKRDHQIILYGGLSLAILFSIFMINRFRVTNRQKEIIETKQKQITDNINYANRIQKTLLPEDKLMNEFFSEFFALYKPKDIVGGDFYWYRSFGDMAAIACVDCTGHGVAGGFMSMMGSLLLDKIIHNNKLNPSDILEQLSNDIIRVLKQDAGGEIQDGMDLSLCIIDKKNMKLHFSGARNGILIIDKENISHYKADLLPVGGAFSRKSRKMSRKFTTQSISITKDSWIIMHSDGYYDQLGGSKTMSMEPEKYKEIIQSAVKTNKDKKEFLMQEFEQWREDFPQVDDLLVIGLRV